MTVSRPQLAVYAAAALAIALIGARYLRDSRPVPATPTTGRPVGVRVQSGGDGWATVQVVGAVRSPGVYRLRAGERVDDAVKRAGGVRARADLTGVNLAAKLEDGRQVIVPERGASAPPAAVGASTAPPSAAVGAAAVPGAPAQPINLNTATVEQLDGLDGVGPLTAQKILAYRQRHGGFRSVSELGSVPGIGEKKLAAMRERVRV